MARRQNQNKYTGQHVLAQIPDDLKAMGWRWVRQESNAVTRLSKTWYKAVYIRPLDRGIDGEVDVLHHGGEWWVRVSTNQNRSVSWEAAHEEAIEAMREADAKRKEAE